MKSTSKAAFAFIFITVLIDITGIGLIYPVLPKLISSLIHADISTAAEYGGWLTFAYAIMQFTCAPIMGNLSDRYGRRPILLLSLLGFGLDCLLMAFAPTIMWLFIGRIIAGAMGASYTVASAYIADISSPEKRAQNFGLISAAFGIGFIIGPVIGGLLGKYGTHAPFLVAALLSFLNLLYGFFVLPESLQKEKRRSFQWSRANPVGSFKHLSKFPAVAGLILALLLINIAGHSIESIWSFFTIEKFNWDEQQIGYSLGFMGIAFASVQAGLTRILLPKLGEKRAIIIGLTLYTFSLTLFAFASQSWMMYAFLVPYALGAISNPALQGFLSNQIPDNEQGELQGGLTSLMSVGAIIGPPIMTFLFARFAGEHAITNFPGAPFFFAALLMLLSLLIVFRSFKKG
ncbi:TCR/Tet family MFS transporter [Olivibacter domesticus]|uniref:MFS transporter, DHA1 family, tetracycline resistance protein n=1 Tax=Olivibacter domesticus TaxID=407022 RepID=A0A1H7ZUL8_OLID1|nr:TCR/Tet family MFS transporter [Olivibacter domesticus]SEM61983.1 MFS transporter, DHA1 family, tetracycline resistance protein [Olivibacter domesticus]